MQSFDYNDVMMSAMASQITSHTIVYSSVYSGAGQRKHQSSASLAFVRGIHGTGEFPAQRASNAEMFPFDDVIMTIENPSDFFLTLHPTDAMQSFISHFNQHSLVNPS